MKFYSSDIPHRMVALSILPPPLPHNPPAPFGFGALIIESRGRGEAAFRSLAHGFGAGYSSERMRTQIHSLFTVETAVLTYREIGDPHELVGERDDFLSAPIWDLIPHMGSRANVHLSLTHDVLGHAAGIGQVVISPPRATPLARLHRLGAEAQAAWIYWLFRSRTPRLRKRLLAAFLAWQEIEVIRQQRRPRI